MRGSITGTQADIRCPVTCRYPADLRCAHLRQARALAAGVLFSALLFAAALANAAAPPSSTLEDLPAKWRDDQGREFLLADLRGQRVILTMAYTSCRQVCPMTLKRLADMQRELDARGEAAQFVIVGYDPKNDESDAWRRYRLARRLTRANWHFLTGAVDDSEALAQRLGFGLWRYDEHVMHDFRIVIFNANGSVKAALEGSRADWKGVL